MMLMTLDWLVVWSFERIVSDDAMHHYRKHRRLKKINDSEIEKQILFQQNQNT